MPFPSTNGLSKQVVVRVFSSSYSFKSPTRGQVHFIPECLKSFDVRIAIPCTSLRKDILFSNNVKLFVGAVPRRYYQYSHAGTASRPRIHEDLYESVINIYRSIMKHSPFHFFINGGNTHFYNRDIDRLPKYYVSDCGRELDLHIINELTLEIPDYLKI
ncbi:MAG: hypothetical protein ACFFD4_12470 [Candidatus Odinarchaeota archaeon]